MQNVSHRYIRLLLWLTSIRYYYYTNVLLAPVLITTGCSKQKIVRESTYTYVRIKIMQVSMSFLNPVGITLSYQVCMWLKSKAHRKWHNLNEEVHYEPDCTAGWLMILPDDVFYIST